MSNQALVTIQAPTPAEVQVFGPDTPSVVTVSVAGPQGPSGPSAYDAAIEEGFQGTQAEWLASLAEEANGIAMAAAEDAAESATAAAGSATAAGLSAASASTKATESAASAQAASTQAGISTTKAQESAASAQAAAGSATAAAASSATATDKAQVATDKATVATTKAQEAAASSTAAAASATAATTAKLGAESARDTAIAAAGGVVNSMTDHLAAADPHPQYTTAQEAAAAAPVQSVAGRTGAVIIATGDVTGLASALSGKADLVNGLVPSAQLPSYVDDVLEFANVAAFPAVGESGKLYISLATNRQYRWSGSVYVEIVGSPGSTDTVPEGSVNLYFTAGRASAAAPVQSVAGRTGNVTLSVGDVSGAVSTSDSRLSDAREWSAATIDQAEAEAGTATTRRAFTAQRVFQAIAAWWAGSAAASKLAGIAPGATANATDAQLRDRSTHTGTQAVSTITGLGTFATANAATPPAIGGTTPAAGAFTGVTLPQQASPPATPSTGFVLFANSSNALGWRGANGFLRVFDGTANTADRTYTLPNASGAIALTSDLPAVGTTTTAGLMPASSFAAISYAASVALDMTALDGQVRTISLTGDLTLTTSNRAAGRTVTLRLVADTTGRSLFFPTGWVFLGTKPTGLAASKTGVLSLTFFGSADTDCVAAWGAQA